MKSLTTDEVQDKRDALELHAHLLNPKTMELVVRSIESRLVDYVIQLLNPELSEADALAARYKALGVIESVNHLSETMRAVEIPVRRAVQKTVRQSFTGDEAY